MKLRVILLHIYTYIFSFLELQDLRMSPIPSIRNRFGGRNSRNEAPDNFPPSFRINRGYSSASGSRSAGGLRRSASGTSSALDKARQVKKHLHLIIIISHFFKNIKVFCLI